MAAPRAAKGITSNTASGAEHSLARATSLVERHKDFALAGAEKPPTALQAQKPRCQLSLCHAQN
jgi:hypothetical protein